MSEIALHVLNELSSAQRALVEQLMIDAATHDGAHPFSESVLIQLRHSSSATHVLAMSGNELAGYAFVENSDPHPKVELAVAPSFRRHGVGHQMLHSIVEHHPDIQLWAHGENASAALLAESEGFHKVRTLFQMRRPLLSHIPDAELPAGIEVRTWDMARDLTEWLRCNTAAFADHPEQGTWTEADVRLRMSESWFDPAGFVVIYKDNRMIGYYWTKVHSFAHRPQADPIGEVYICGVIPEFQGQGIGSALIVSALKYLRKLGLTTAMLYVDSRDEDCETL